jgi:hypothetical protein
MSHTRGYALSVQKASSRFQTAKVPFLRVLFVKRSLPPNIPFFFLPSLAATCNELTRTQNAERLVAISDSIHVMSGVWEIETRDQYELHIRSTVRNKLQNYHSAGAENEGGFN